MLKKLFQPFTNVYTGPIIVIAIVIAIITLVYLPKESTKNNQSQLQTVAVNLIESVRDFRAYYTQNVISKVVHHHDLWINYDHAIKQDTIPLPATLLHDMSEIIPRDGMSMKMYSHYPFPNRANRVLDEYEKKSIEYLTKNPYDVFAQVVEKDGKKTYRVAVADTLNQPACVKCHNTRADSPKTDWKLNDVRGIIEVIIPYKEDFVLTPTQTKYLMIGLIFILFAMGVHYTVVSIMRKKEHTNLEKYLQETIEEQTLSLKQTNKLLEQYKNAVDASAIVSKTDEKGIITYINDEFVRISGYTREELIGKPHNIVRHPSMPKEVFKELWTTIKAQCIWQGQIQNMTKDGGSYYVSSTIVPIIDANGKTQEYLAIRLNVTDIIEANIKAKEADRAKSTFLANMSHEIRTPLNAIIGFSEILTKSDKLDIQNKKYANIIGTSAVSLLSIINDILDMSKIESGKFEINKEPTDLAHTCEHVIELFSAKAHQKDIKLLFNMELLPSCLVTDGVRIRQVLSNLIGNAIKFTPNNGTITVDIKIVEKNPKNAMIKFSIKDTGIGIPQDKISTIFDPFTQVDNEANRKYDGTGLGLNICYNIVKALGGELVVKSALDFGSEFFFTLECAICDEKLHETTHTVQDLKICINDEDSELFVHAKKYLSLFGQIIPSNEENKNLPDLIVCTCETKDSQAMKQMKIDYPNKPILYLFEDNSMLENIVLSSNEKAIALPLYASKINDSIQELLLESTKENLSSVKNTNTYTGKVLIAEDNSANQELIKYIFDDLNLEFTIANNGLEALEFFKKDRYDIVFLDINMPIMDGMEACRKIIEHEKENNLTHTPIVALTANAIKGDREKFLGIGMDNYLTKPIETSKLCATLDLYLNKNTKPTTKVDITNTDNEKVLQTQTNKLTIDPLQVSQKLGVSEKIASLLISKFEISIKKDLEELKTIIESGNKEEIKNKAHYIKNSCLNMSLDQVCEILQNIETSNLDQEQLKVQLKSLFDILL